MEDYRLIRRIGDGSQGVVYEVEHISTHSRYAMKVICCTDQTQVNVALKEIKVLLQMRHPNIVSYVDFFLVFNSTELQHHFTEAAMAAKEDRALSSLESRRGFHDVDHLAQVEPTSRRSRTNNGTSAHASWLSAGEMAVCLVMELCSNGDLYGMVLDSKQKLMQSGTHPLTEARVLSWLEQCAAALAYIHEAGFLHRDLKPTNIFFDAYQDIKIGDFGLAAAVGLGRESTVGTPHYLAPERMLQQKYNNKVDVWALGVVMLELITLRDVPINSMVLENPAIVDTVVQHVTNMGFSAALKDLLRDMLQRTPESRPSPAVVMQRLSAMSTSPVSTSLGMSLSAMNGMGCPKLQEPLCDMCEVDLATVLCANCKTAFCDACDRARHKHHSRQSHERTAISSFLSGCSASVAPQQPTLSSSRSSPSGSFGVSSPTFAALHSSQAKNSMPAYSRLTASARRPPPAGMSISNFSLSQSMPVPRPPTGGGEAVVLRVPLHYPDIAAALAALTHLPQVRKLSVAGGLVHNAPIVLNADLPEGLKIVGESPAPVLEVAGSPFAVHCATGKGVLENFIIRHVGRGRSALQPIHANTQPAVSVAGAGTDPNGKKASRPTAILVTGGEWRLHQCRISCVDGCGMTVGKGSSGPAGPTDANASLEEAAVIDPVVTKCSFMDVTTAGVVVLERARGLYERNSFSSCGYAAFLLKRDSAARIRGNRIVDGTEAGIFCQDAAGTVEYNVIAQNSGCGVVVKGPNATCLFRKNRVLSNTKAGFFCCDRASPFLSENEIRHNQMAGVLIKTKASPKVTRNTIESGKEAGVYVFESGAGIIEDNRIRGNRNAGVLVTTNGSPLVTQNVITRNAYEGIWVCKQGGGTFCKNDLRGNVKGAKDVEKECSVTWVDNQE